MTRDEATELLGLPPDADTATIRRRHGEAYAEYQVRLTNAPTTALQRLYREKLAQLQAAQAVLLGGDGSDYAELPALTPVAVQAGSASQSSDEPPARPQRDDSSARGSAQRRRTWGRMVTVLALVVATAAAALWWGHTAQQERQAEALMRESIADDSLWVELKAMRDRGEYRDAAAVANLRGRPGVVVRLREVCQSEAELGLLAAEICP